MLRLFVLSSLGRLAVLGLAGLLLHPLAAAEAAAAVRIGIVLPKAQLGQGNPGRTSRTVRQLIMSYMAGPVLELVALEARIPAQIDAEARGLNSLTCSTRASSRRRAEAVQAGCSARWGPRPPCCPASERSAARRAAIAAGVAYAGDHDGGHGRDAATGHGQPDASPVRQRQGEGRGQLTYQFVTVGGAKPALEDTLSAKAKQDGQDLLSPLVEQLATVAVTAALQP